jgi:integrase
MPIKKVKRRVDGKYKIVFVFDAYIDNRRVRTPRGKYFASYKDCEQAISALRTDSIRKEYGLGEPDKPTVTLSQLGEKWVASLKANRRSKGYYLRAERVMKTFAEITKDKPIIEVSTLDLQNYAQHELKNGKRVEGKKEGTVKEHLNVAYVGLNAASLLFPELQNYRPPRKPKLGLPESARERVITAEEEAQIIAAYMTPRKRENIYYKLTREQGAKIFWFALRTAMRAGEIIGLRRSSVIFDSSPKMPDGFIIVQEQRGGGRTKTGKIRKIPMTPSVVAMLKSHLASHQSEYVFPSIINPAKPIGQFYT